MARSVVWCLLLEIAYAALLRSNRSLLDPAEQRMEVCRYCGKLCPISCFVGTCGMDYGFTVRKFQATSKCYSCDPGTSVGISKQGDFIRCTNEESGLPEPGSESAFAEPSAEQAAQQGPHGPAVEGDASYHANLASTNADTAMRAAEEAAIHASKAAEAATARYRQVSQSGASGGVGGTEYADMSKSDLASQHQMATQVRAEQALRTAETAHIAWKTAMQQYNAQLALLRKQQILTDKAEKVLQAAEETSEKARGEYASMQAEAQHALEASLAMGGSAASRITARAAAEELAGTAQAAQQRLLIAAKEAKDAAKKISIATSLKPCMPTSVSLISIEGSSRKCTPVLLQTQRAPGSPALIGCEPVIGCESVSAEQLKAQKLATPKITPLVSANQPSIPVVSASPVQSVPQIEALDADGQQTLIDVEPVQTLEVPNIEQQLTQNLAQKLAENPAAVEDPSVFAAPTVPFSPEQMPIDGTEKIPNFDFSTGGMAALQRSDRRMLRQSK